MNMILKDGVLDNPEQYVKEILNNEFVEVCDGVNTFKNLQPRDHNDEFAQEVLHVVGPGYNVAWNFVRCSPLDQEEPNFIHTDEMMGDLTAILYLSKDAPEEDGTTIYDETGKKSFVVHSAFNRMIVFDSKLPHSRNIFENFGDGETARLIQVAFLKEDRDDRL